MGRLSELKTTIDAGLAHRGNLLQSIGDQYEQWSRLVGVIITTRICLIMLLASLIVLYRKYLVINGSQFTDNFYFDLSPNFTLAQIFQIFKVCSLGWTDGYVA